MDLPPGQPRLTRRTPRASVYRKANRRRRCGAALRGGDVASAAATTNLWPPHAIDHPKVFPRLLFAILGVTTSYVSTYYILSIGLFFGIHIRGTTSTTRRQGPLGRTLCMGGNDGLSTSSSASPHVLYSIMETDHAREPTRDCRCCRRRHCRRRYRRRHRR